MNNNGFLVIVYLLSMCFSTSSFSDEVTDSKKWISSDELNEIRISNNKNRRLPSYIEGRISNNKLQFKAEFSPFPFGIDRYYSIWGYSGTSYEHRNIKFLANGYEQLFHSTFTDLSGNVLHQATWVLYEKPEKTLWEKISEFIFDSFYDNGLSITPSGIKTLTNETLNKEIKLSNGYLLVHFSSYDPACGYCISSNKYINNLSLKYEDNLSVARMTWEPWDSYKVASEKYTKQYKIVGIPKFILFNNGVEIWRGTGNTHDNKNKIEEILQKSGSTR